MAYGIVNVGGGASGPAVEAVKTTAEAAEKNAGIALKTASDALNTANSAKSAADSAVTAANSLKEIFEQTNGSEIGGEITLSFYAIGTEPPDNTKLLWIDTALDGTGGLKYHNGTAWTAVPVAWG